MNSRARAVAGCDSKGRITMFLSNGSPGTIFGRKIKYQRIYKMISIALQRLPYNKLIHTVLSSYNYNSWESD